MTAAAMTGIKFTVLRSLVPSDVRKCPLIVKEFSPDLCQLTMIRSIGAVVDYRA